MSYRVLLLATLLPLAACGGGKGTSVTINTSDAESNITFGTDANGQVAIDSPVFKGKLTLPKIQLDAGNFDMNGVHLYPGSTIASMNVDSHQKTGEKDQAHVRVAFASPAAPATVRDWFRGKLDAAGYRVQADGAGLSGRTDEDKPFRLDLTPDGTDKAKGVITIG